MYQAKSAPNISSCDMLGARPAKYASFVLLRLTRSCAAVCGSLDIRLGLGLQFWFLIKLLIYYPESFIVSHVGTKSCGGRGIPDCVLPLH